ncbi:MAG: tetraacyldisaccharide 4'-kinase [Betaproteobacteria bacterium]
MNKLTQFLAQTLERSWLKGSRLAWVFAPVLWPLSKLIWFTLRWYAVWQPSNGQDALPVALLVVGNVYVGGVGKTPLVIALVEHFKTQGIRVGVISRGYAARGTNLTRAPKVLSAQDQATAVGDEPMLIFKRTGVPVCVGVNRHLAAKHLLHLHPQVQVIISDDGLQNNNLSPEMTVCVFDNRGLGNGWTLPAGPLREVWPRTKGLHPSQSAPYQWVVNTGDHPQISGFAAQRSLAKKAFNAQGVGIELVQLQAHPKAELMAVAGVGQPHLFFDMLKNLGLDIDRCLTLPDHAGEEDYVDLLKSLKLESRPNTHILCTEKDAVKLWSIYPQALAVALEMQLPSAFLKEIDQALAEVMHNKRAFSKPSNADMI